MEAPPIKPFLFSVVCLGIFAILLITLPTDFIGDAQEFKESTVPDYFDALEITEFAERYNFTMESGSHMFTKNFGNHDLLWHSLYYVPHFRIWLKHYMGEIPIIGYRIDVHSMMWTGRTTQTQYTEKSNGYFIDSEAVKREWNTETNTSNFRVECKHFMMYVWFAYNVSKYETVEDAYDDDALQVLWAIDFDEMGTGMNAWNLVGMMLFFQLPQGIPHPVNFILCFPLWVMESWLIFSILLAVIKSFPFT